jgi:hypothetical protein
MLSAATMRFVYVNCEDLVEKRGRDLVGSRDISN